MVANVATLSLAAAVCPTRAEGFTFAALMSVINLASPLSDTIGAVLYEHVFASQLATADRGLGGVHRVRAGAGAVRGPAALINQTA